MTNTPTELTAEPPTHDWDDLNLNHSCELSDAILNDKLKPPFWLKVGDSAFLVKDHCG